MADQALARDLWQDVISRIQSTDGFQTPPFLSVMRFGNGDPEEVVQELVGAAGKAGLVVGVQEPLWIGVDNIRSQARVLVDVMENPELNRGVGGTGRHSADVAEAIVARLANWQPDLIPASPLRLVSVEKPEGTGGMLHRITFTTTILV